MSTSPRYVPSGSFRLLPTLALALLAAVGGAGVAWLYQHLIDWIPLIYLGFLFTVGFAFVLALGLFFALKAGHCRSRVVGWFFALVVGVSGVAASHVWAYRFTFDEVQTSLEKDGDREAAAHLGEMLDFSSYLDFRQEAGWTLSKGGSGGLNLNGWMVYAIWGIEALGILFLCFIGANMATAEPYCERCQRWTDDQDLLLAGRSSADVSAAIAAGDLDALLAVEASPEASPVALSYKLAACPACPRTGYLSIEEQRVELDDKGKESKKTTTLLEHVELSHERLDRFRARLASAAPAQV
jgi:hypothetical protein